jgi:hypothetical protein
MKPPGDDLEYLSAIIVCATFDLNSLFPVSVGVSNIPTKVLVQRVLCTFRFDLAGGCVERPLVFSSLVHVRIVCFTRFEPDFVAVLVGAIFFESAGFFSG